MGMVRVLSRWVMTTMMMMMMLMVMMVMTMTMVVPMMMMMMVMTTTGGDRDDRVRAGHGVSWCVMMCHGVSVIHQAIETIAFVLGMVCHGVS